MSAYWRGFDETRYMSFLIKDEELFEKCSETWKKVSKNNKKEFDNEPVCCEKYLKTKISILREKTTQNVSTIKIKLYEN